MVRKIFVALFAIWLCCLTSLTAQEPTLKVRCFKLSGEKYSKVYLLNKGEIIPVQTSTVAPSRVATVTYQNPLPIFLTPTPPEGEEFPIPADRISLPEGVSEILIFIRETPNDYSFGAMEDVLFDSDPRDWLFINTTSSEIAFNLGHENKKPLIIKPRSTASHRVSEKQEGMLFVQAAANTAGDLRKIYSTDWPVREGRRVIAMITAEGERIRIRPIFERIPDGD